MSVTRGVLAIVQAGGQGSRMDVLTRERAKPALPFGGHYQLVDFPLSSLAHSGIDDVWLSVQFQAQSLHRHVAGGRPWDLDRTRGGLRWVVPAEGDGAPTQSGFSRGNADNLYRMSDEISAHGAQHVVVMSSDSIFALDLAAVVDDHVSQGAECTVVTTEVRPSQAKEKAVVTVGRDGTVTDIAYKPSRPASRTIASEIFVYDADALLTTLERLRAQRHTDADDEDDTGLGDFGEHLLPALVERGRVRAYPMSGYWRDVGTPEDYLTAHRDLVAGRIHLLADDDWPILTRWPELAPARVRTGATVEDSALTNGCDVRGTVRRSVLGPGVVVEKGAVVEDSVIFARTEIAAGARVSTSIVDSKVRIGRGAQVGALARSTKPRTSEITLVGRHSDISAGAVVAAGGRLEPGTTA